MSSVVGSVHPVSYGALAQNYAGGRSVVGAIAKRNVIDGGAHKIIGTTKNTATPSNLPVSRLVILHESQTGRVVASTWSAPFSGAYQFLNMRVASYYVCSFDHTGAYNAVIADKPPLEPM